jgi:hypothetical protein
MMVYVGYAISSILLAVVTWICYQCHEMKALGWIYLFIIFLPLLGKIGKAMHRGQFLPHYVMGLRVEYVHTGQAANATTMHWRLLMRTGISACIILINPQWQTSVFLVVVEPFVILKLSNNAIWSLPDYVFGTRVVVMEDKDKGGRKTGDGTTAGRST